MTTEASTRAITANAAFFPLISGRLLARNTIWNLASLAAPLLVALVAMPILIRSIGLDRFGVLSVAWMLIGYFSLFDFGIDEGLTKMVADRLGTGAVHDIPPLVWTSLAILLLLGLVSGVLMGVLSPWIVERALKIPSALREESLHAFYLLSLGMPIAIVTSGVRGVLEATQSFALLSAIRIPMGVFNFAGPLLVLPFSRSLLPILAVLLLGRLVALAAHLVAAIKVVPSLRALSFDYGLAKPVLHFGSWITVSNVVSPVMMNMDRFFIGSFLSMAAVSFYAAPFELVTKFLFLPGALGVVLFPAFAISYVSDRDRMAVLLGRGSKYVFLAVFPVVLILFTLAPEGLQWWLGTAFAERSTSVLRWLAAGVLINCLATIPSMLIHAVGRPDVTAKLHLLELPVYLAGVWLFIRNYGIDGAAWAWTLRVALDGLLIAGAAVLLLPETSRIFTRLGTTILASVGLLLAATLPSSMVSKQIFLLVALSFIGWLAWAVLLVDAEKDYVRPILSLRRCQQWLSRSSYE